MEAGKGEVPSSLAFLRSVTVKPGKVDISLSCFAFICREGFKLFSSPCAGAVLLPVAYHVVQLHEGNTKLLTAFALEVLFKQTTWVSFWFLTHKYGCDNSS